MSKISFENFGNIAEKAEDNTIIASRYLIQKEGEQTSLPLLFCALHFLLFLDLGL